jgi:hypothetical protein
MFLWHLSCLAQHVGLQLHPFSYKWHYFIFFNGWVLSSWSIHW